MLSAISNNHGKNWKGWKEAGYPLVTWAKAEGRRDTLTGLADCCHLIFYRNLASSQQRFDVALRTSDTLRSAFSRIGPLLPTTARYFSYRFAFTRYGPLLPASVRYISGLTCISLLSLRLRRPREISNNRSCIDCLKLLLFFQGAYNALVGAGITFFDTSDVYGYKSAKSGYSAEQLLGRFAEQNPTVRISCMCICVLNILEYR